MPQWITLTFSNRQMIPKANEIQNGSGGLRHNQIGYLTPLQVIATCLGRRAVFPPPWLSLTIKHNKGINIDYDKLWKDYFDISKFKNVDFNPPFTFKKNGLILTNKKIKYYDSNIDLRKIDNNVDIIVLCNYNDKSKGKNRKRWSPIRIQCKNHKLNIKYNVSIKLKNIAKSIISEYKDGYTFIHLRRGDYLHNKVLAPPLGTILCTNPEFIARFVNKTKRIGKTIIIATDEVNIDYKNKIIELLPNNQIILEENIISNLDEEIVKDNYMVYQVMDEIARRSKINIGTVSLKLGKKMDYCLYKMI